MLACGRSCLSLVVLWRSESESNFPSSSSLLNADRRLQGSSTACILALEGATLHAANLGDSGFMVVRRNKVAFKSRSQQHQFNYPFQLGRGGRFPFDQPAAAEVRP